MARLFVSYRREDSAGFAGRLTDALERVYGDGSVFRDVDDIRAGEDFAQVIARGLEQVDAVLVLIGPAWLEAQHGGQRRLDVADDFVRREIEGALVAGKPLLPLLVGGASMPSAESLPATIRPLAGRQALVLGDASWRSDFASLLSVLRPLLGDEEARAAGSEASSRARRRRLLALGLTVVLVGAVALIASPPRDRPKVLPAVEGEWVGQVDYPWGLRMDERFEFALRDGAVAGSASFLGLPRTIESGAFRDGRLQFMTRSDEVLGGGAPREVFHHYAGEVLDGEIRFVLESRGGYGVPPPTRFVVRRR